MDLLIEDAEFIADAIADGGTLQGGQRIEVTGSEPSQAAIAQPRLLFGLKDRVEVLTQLGESSARLAFDPGDSPGCCPDAGPSGIRPIDSRRLSGGDLSKSAWTQPTLLHAVAHGQCQRSIVMRRRQDGSWATNRVTQMIRNGLLQSIGLQSGPNVHHIIEPP